jgi:outer membrane protein
MHSRFAQLGGRTGFRAFKTALLISVLASIGTAQADTLTDAFVKAYQTNPQLAAQRAALRATDEDVSKAIAQWRPTVTLNGNYSDVDARTKAGSGPAIKFEGHPYDVGVVANQTLFAGGRILAQRREADARVEQGRALLHQTEQGVFIDTVTAFMDTVRDEAVLKLNEQNVTLLKKQLEASKARFEVGEITRTDVAQSEAALARGEAQLIAAQASLKASRLAYEHVVGEAPSTLVAPVIPPLMPDTEETALGIGKQLNPDLVAARANEHATGYGIDFAVGQLLPTIGVQASYDRLGGQSTSPGATTDQTIIAGVVTWPLYQGGAEWANIRQAKELNSQARLTVLDVERAVSQGVSNSWESLRAAKSSTVANSSQVKAEQLAFEGVQQELEVGSRTTLDVLNEQQTLLNAQVALVRSEHDEVVAGYQLLASVGKLTAKELGLPVTLYDPEDNYDMQTWRPFGATTLDD